MKANHGKDSGREGIIVAARQDYREMRTVSSGDGSSARQLRGRSKSPNRGIPKRVGPEIA